MAIFRCSLTSSVILLTPAGRQVCYQNKDDNQLVQVLHEDFVHAVHKVGWWYWWWSQLSMAQGLLGLEPKLEVMI